MSKTITSFNKIYDQIQKSDNGSSTNRLSGFLANISRRSNISFKEAESVGLDAIFKIANNLNNIKNKEALEACIWKAIRKHIINYINNGNSFNRDRLINECIELDFEYGYRDTVFDQIDKKIDIERIMRQLDGEAWILANLLYDDKIRNNKVIICKAMGISYERFAILKERIKFFFEKNGY